MRLHAGAAAKDSCQLRSDTPASAVGAGLRFLVVTVAWLWLGVLVLERIEHVAVAVLAWGVSIAASSSTIKMCCSIPRVIGSEEGRR